MPAEPPATPWHFPHPSRADDEGIVGVGADLEPGTLLAAYRSGLFPMPLGSFEGAPMAWWSPDPRGIIPLDGLRVTRSLRRSVRRYTTTVDRAFEQVIGHCGHPRRPHGWITDEIRAAYVRLHRLGWAHSVETWTPEGELVGGLYGVSTGGLFAGESMFSLAPDASKVALVRLVDGLRAGGAVLLDVQWVTPHLATLGAVEIPRARYLDLLADAVSRSHVVWPG
jgi:leucyl/phenylalanyl-tRNA--protein transferase